MRVKSRDGFKRERSEPTIALINIVFLMLIFFLIAGTLAPPLDPDLTLVNTSDLDGREPPDALVIHADGSLSFRQTPVTVESYLAGLDSVDGDPLAVRMVPDQALPAQQLIELTAALSEQGADRIFIVTQKTIGQVAAQGQVDP